MSALHWTLEPPARGWYQCKKLRTGKIIPGHEHKRTSGKSVIAVMRKSIKGLWYALVRDTPFDPKKLFFKDGTRCKDFRRGSIQAEKN